MTRLPTFDNPGGYANADCVIWEILVYQRSSAHYAPEADTALGHDCGADPDKRTSTNLHVAPEVNAWSDVCVIADLVVMIDCAAGVENGIRADRATGIDDNSGTECCALANLHIRRHNSSWMPGGDKLLALLLELLEQTPASMVIADAKDQSIVGDLGQIGNTAKDAQAKPHLAL
jgi:hypothetical protein